jgi:hypothetical protein
MLSHFSTQNYTWARDYLTVRAEISYTQYYLHRGLQEGIGLPVEGMMARKFTGPAIIHLVAKLSAMPSGEEFAVYKLLCVRYCFVV